MVTAGIAGTYLGSGGPQCGSPLAQDLRLTRTWPEKSIGCDNRGSLTRKISRSHFTPFCRQYIETHRNTPSCRTRGRTRKFCLKTFEMDRIPFPLTRKALPKSQAVPVMQWARILTGSGLTLAASKNVHPNTKPYKRGHVLPP